MATTSPDEIWTPDSGDQYALTTDLAAMADTIQDALNVFRGTVSGLIDSLADTGWVSLGTLNTGWSVVSGLLPHYRVKAGVLYFWGRISSTGATNNPFASALPSTARPGIPHDGAVVTSSGAIINAGIGTNGVINILTGSGGATDIYLHKLGPVPL